MLTGFIIGYLVLTLLIGFWAARRVRSSEDFVLAGRSLPAFLAASAIFGTWFGSETVLGASAEFAARGVLGIIKDPIGAALCLLLIGLFFARPFYRMNILTFSDFYRNRFGRATELLSGLCMIPSYFGWVAAQFVAIGIVLQSVTGIGQGWGILIGAGIVLAYTYWGGMWAISVTDFLQTMLIIVGLLVLAYQLVAARGGIGPVLADTPEGFFDFWPRQGGVQAWAAYVTAWMTVSLGSIPQQDVFQRVMAARSERTAVQASLVGAGMYLTVAMLPMFIGLMAKQLHPELFAGDPQLALPALVMRHGSLWLQVLFFGALLSAIMSTASGGLLAPATVLAENLIRPWLPVASDRRMLWVLRMSVLTVAVIAVGMAYHTGSIYDLVAQSSALSLVSLFVPMMGGLYWRKANGTGAMASMVAGMLVWWWIEWAGWPEWALPAGTLASLLALLAGTWAAARRKGKKKADGQGTTGADS